MEETEEAAEIVCDMLSLKEGEEVQKSRSSKREMGSHLEPTRMRRTERMWEAYAEKVRIMCGASKAEGSDGSATTAVGIVVGQDVDGGCCAWLSRRIGGCEVPAMASKLVWYSSISRRI